MRKLLGTSLLDVYAGKAVVKGYILSVDPEQLDIDFLCQAEQQVRVYPVSNIGARVYF